MPACYKLHTHGKKTKPLLLSGSSLKTQTAPAQFPALSQDSHLCFLRLSQTGRHRKTEKQTREGFSILTQKANALEGGVSGGEGRPRCSSDSLPKR